MGRPRPKVSKSTVRGQPFAVKAIQRAKIQQQMDPDELEARMMFQVPLDLSEDEMAREIKQRIGMLDLMEVARGLFGFPPSMDMDFGDGELETTPKNESDHQVYMDQLKHVAKEVVGCLDKEAGRQMEEGLDEEAKAALRLRQRTLRYRFYSMLERGNYQKYDQETIRSVSDEGTDNENGSDGEQNSIDREETSNHEGENGNEKDQMNEEDNSDDSSKPESEVFTIESIPKLHVPRYSILLETGRNPPSYYKNGKMPDMLSSGLRIDQRSSGRREDKPLFFEQSRPAQTKNNHMDPEFLKQHLTYGPLGDNLLIYKALENHRNGSIPRFLNWYVKSRMTHPTFDPDPEYMIPEQLNTKTSTNTTSIEEKQDRNNDTDSNSQTSDGTPFENKDINYSSPPALGPQLEILSEHQTTSFGLTITPAKYGDYVISIPYVDFVKPIILDGYVKVNGKHVVATPMATGTNFQPSFRSEFSKIMKRGRAGPDASDKVTAKATDTTNSDPTTTTTTITTTTTDTSTTDTKPSYNQPNQFNDMTAALRGCLALELKAGFLKGRVSSLHALVEQGNKILAQKAAQQENKKVQAA